MHGIENLSIDDGCQCVQLLRLPAWAEGDNCTHGGYALETATYPLC